MSAEDENKTPFVPRSDVIIGITKSNISLYTSLPPGCSVDECAYAFCINRNAIKIIPADARLKIDTMGT